MAVCKGGHRFIVEKGIIDLMPNITDKNLLNEASYFDQVFESDRNYKINLNHNIGIRLQKEAIKLFKQIIAIEWPDYQRREICLGEIGCGDGSAVWYFGEIPFRFVNYIGVDISMKSLQYGAKKVDLPANWRRQYVRGSANVPIFNKNSLDMIVSLGALHHTNTESVIRWVANSLKKDGLFIMEEPSHNNPFAKVGRKLVRGVNTEDEKQLNPSYIKNISNRCGLKLILEKGMDFLTGPLGFLFGMVNLPNHVVSLSYYFGRSIDYFFRSPSLNYRFLHIYKNEGGRL